MSGSTETFFHYFTKVNSMKISCIKERLNNIKELFKTILYERTETYDHLRLLN